MYYIYEIFNNCIFQKPRKCDNTCDMINEKDIMKQKKLRSEHDFEEDCDGINKTSNSTEPDDPFDLSNSDSFDLSDLEVN